MNLKGIRFKDKTFFDLILYIEESEENDIIVIKVKFNDTIIKAEEEYYFTALQLLRKQLLEKGIDICCYGAKKNVYPSPMMMTSSKAYFLTMGKQAEMADIVDIFSPCELYEITTVEEQNIFYKEWIRSLTQ